MKFEDAKLKPDLQKALTKMGFLDMTPIQEATLPHVLEGRDLVGLAETGSGKTSACAVPVVNMTEPSERVIQVLVLAPTRELAQQYVSEIDRLAEYTGVEPFAIFGGFDMSIQSAKLRNGVHILVATPGRLIDFLYNSDVLTLKNVKTLILDEADEMLDMGFWDDVNFIMSCMVHEHQTLLFSATMPNEISELVKTFLKDPVRIQLNKDQVAPQSLKHLFKMTRPHERTQEALDFVRQEDVGQSIFFVNTRGGGDKLLKELKQNLNSIDYIHGGLSQEVRTSIFNKFRSKKIKHMIATDVAGRGLDFSHVTHVINYDFPRDPESYTHRTGRTGRMGRKGKAFSLITGRDMECLKRVLANSNIEDTWLGDKPDLSRKSSPRKRNDGSGRGGNRRYGKGGRR